jgi:hypothetical protein
MGNPLTDDGCVLRFEYLRCAVTSIAMSAERSVARHQRIGDVAPAIGC